MSKPSARAEAAGFNSQAAATRNPGLKRHFEALAGFANTRARTAALRERTAAVRPIRQPFGTRRTWRP
jgi:hypothetical protein